MLVKFTPRGGDKIRMANLVLLLALATPAPAAAAPACKSNSDMLVLLDASGSMKGTKWTSATMAVGSLVSAFGGKIRFGLMLFPSSGASCAKGKVNVPVANGNKAAINTALLSRTPSGMTPMGATLTAAETYLGSIDPLKKKYVVIITDGGESCSGNPVAAVTSLYKAGVTTFVVGFGSGVAAATLKSMALAGGAPLSSALSFYQASNAAQLTAALKKIGAATDCCGNGVLDSGELCDTAIVSGKKGACPKVCKDNDPCTKDKIVGTLCTAACKHTLVLALINGDGCCPPGATYSLDTDCPNLCGNGKVDAGEKCDTSIMSGKKGACPKVCKDNDPCTKDKILGTLCTAVCKHIPVMALVNGDGCCPPGANYSLDTDCPNLCGNGKVDAGEKCDTAILIGSAGACPSKCQDNDQCTTDQLTGKLCWASCVFGPITAAKNNDGCCPPGAVYSSDNDCPNLCGNGKLDSGETCDTLITSGTGKCKSLADCQDGDPCTVDSLTGSACTAACLNKVLPPSDENKDGCCPAGMTRLTDADCPPACGPDKLKDCVDLCKGIECSPGQVCNYGKCIPAPEAGVLEDGGLNQTPGAGLDGSDLGCDCRVSGGGAPLGLLWIPLLALLARLIRRRS